MSKQWKEVLKSKGKTQAQGAMTPSNSRNTQMKATFKTVR